MLTITIACPEAMIPDANQLALCLGYGPDDDKTFGLPLWQDAQGNRYSIASGLVGENFQQTATSPLVEPAWGCDMDAARRAQAVTRIGGTADPSRLVAVFGDDPQAAIAVLGLAQVDTSGA